jgi:hypothetical protein
MSAQMRRLISIATVTVLLGQLGQAPAHTTHPDAQWFPDAAYNLDGKPWPITPREYC